MGQGIHLRSHKIKKIPPVLRRVKVFFSLSPQNGGDFYEGDLLKNLLQSDPQFWQSHADLYQEMKIRCQIHFSRIDDLLVSETIQMELKKAIQKF
jgi:hypothetical protein